MPKISVIIPNYNHALYLKERIDSVLEQTFQDFEVIILDDKSTDDSRAIIEHYNNHPKVSNIIFNTENSGSTFKQWNRGLQLVSGEWIWIAESDDVAHPQFLEVLVENISKHPDMVIAYAQSNRMNSEGEITGTWLNHTKNNPTDFSEDFLMNGTDFIEKNLIERNAIPNASAVLFKKTAVQNAGLVDEDIQYNSDWLYWMKLLLQGDVFFSAKPLNNFRYHNKSVIAKALQNDIVPFEKKYDIIMFQRFLDYLRVKNKTNLLHIFKKQISYMNFAEFQFLVINNFKMQSIRFFVDGLSQAPNKIKFLRSTMGVIKRKLIL